MKLSKKVQALINLELKIIEARKGNIDPWTPLPTLLNHARVLAKTFTSKDRAELKRFIESEAGRRGVKLYGPWSF